DVVVVRADDQDLLLQLRIAAGPEAAHVLERDRVALALQRAALDDRDRELGAERGPPIAGGLAARHVEQGLAGGRREIAAGTGLVAALLARRRQGAVARALRDLREPLRRIARVGTGLAQEDQAQRAGLADGLAPIEGRAAGVEAQRPLALDRHLGEILFRAAAAEDDRAFDLALRQILRRGVPVVLAEDEAARLRALADREPGGALVDALAPGLVLVEVAVLRARMPAHALQARAQEARGDALSRA